MQHLGLLASRYSEIFYNFLLNSISFSIPNGRRNMVRDLHTGNMTLDNSSVGAIFSLDVFNQHIVVVNSFKVANELFGERC